MSEKKTEEQDALVDLLASRLAETIMMRATMIADQILAITTQKTMQRLGEIDERLDDDIEPWKG